MSEFLSIVFSSLIIIKSVDSQEFIFLLILVFGFRQIFPIIIKKKRYVIFYNVNFLKLISLICFGISILCLYLNNGIVFLLIFVLTLLIEIFSSLIIYMQEHKQDRFRREK